MTVALKAHWPEWRDHDVLVIVAIFENLSKLRAAFVQPNLRNLRNLRIIQLARNLLTLADSASRKRTRQFHFVI